jgi:hypothetical protein
VRLKLSIFCLFQIAANEAIIAVGIECLEKPLDEADHGEDGNNAEEEPQKDENLFVEHAEGQINEQMNYSLN